MKVEFHPATVDDLDEAARWYGRARSGLDKDFGAEVDAAIEWIARNPLQHPVVEENIPRCLVHRFPCSILYRVFDPDRVRILVVRYHRRGAHSGLGRT